ncbi:DNA polymerase III subunit delta [Streptomyces xanthochromogenes]|uniref:DNA polymerase III subunit delta' n=1 Tax=Streptomyces xanthochromogenes TaxID=67384 RepID=UPI0016775D3D|nr:DNA polymerase III subunit delta' [Streptomyces xanthochromogenes]GHB43137.1 DNA polymerase III subunit delta [Streptomyces xanthochromogenes]
MAVWDDLVGQAPLQEQLSAAARDADALITAERSGEPRPEASKMTHAWLFTGPPGSGGPTAARAFAAALQCVSPDRALGGEPGCGFCDGCHTALIGTHADVTVITTEGLTIGVKQTRELVRGSQMSPSGGRWQVIIVEDADRFTEQAANAVLKAVEEPAPRTVWLLCAPSLEDVLPTIKSRCRHLTLRTPPVEAIADVLIRRDGIEPEAAYAAARATQGHIGRARRLATDAAARARRAAVLKVPLRVEDVGGCLKAAQELVDTAAEDAKQQADEVDVKETEDLKAAMGGVAGGRMPRGTAGVMKELEDKQKRRKTRTQRDSLDLALTELTGFYRDVLTLQMGTRVAIANEDVRDAVDRIARASGPERTLRRIESILACREALDRNVAPLLAMESMTLALRAG